VASPPILGMPMVEVAWCMLFVAVAIVSPVVPFHRWLPDALEQGPAAAGIVLGGVVVALGPYLLVRVGLGAVPEGARWAGGCVATLGALAALWASLCAMVQRDLRRFFAYTTVATSGIALYGVGALTPVGIAGGMIALFAHGLSAVLVLGCAVALDERVQTCDVGRVGALVVDAPALRVLAGVGLAVSLGVPGLAGSWSVVLALLGGFVRYPVLAAVVTLSLLASAAAHLRIARLLLMGQADPTWRQSAQLAPFGGRLPDAAPHELFALVPTAAVAFVLGVWPSPILASMAVSARDCSAVVDPDGPDARLLRSD
jgi:NADH-quinone oxidoreductase subunit M